MEMSTRDPYPFPQLQNDSDFMNGQNFTTNVAYSEPTHLAQKKDPWNRLYETCTLTSARREVHHYDPKAPKDSLDFILKADYDHHNQLLEPTSRTLIQPETIGKDHGRILKNRVQKEVVTDEEKTEPSIKKVSIQNPKKESIDSVKGAIESHHSAATNGGYSRKHDGGFYTT
ncbi:protein CFAP276-like [Apostichopus japonicus]|uniref:protein CFAP276-like n=1 Tax=Stichopus japonicus TaxID=307972 RepID=UPI003AB41BF0